MMMSPLVKLLSTFPSTVVGKARYPEMPHHQVPNHDHHDCRHNHPQHPNLRKTPNKLSDACAYCGGESSGGRGAVLRTPGAGTEAHTQDERHTWAARCVCINAKRCAMPSAEQLCPCVQVARERCDLL